MRDWLVLILVVATIPLAFWRPFIGLLGFSWLAYMRPQDLAWGMASQLPLSKYVALALYASLIVRGKINIFRRHPVIIALLVLWAWLFVSCCMAQQRDVAFQKFEDISKVMLIALLTVILVSSERRFRVSLAVIGFSLGFLGLKYGLYGILRGGVRFTRGVGGMIGDNNDFALALNMTLPLLVYVAGDVKQRWVKLAAIGLVPLTAITVVFTHSRGGFLSLAAITLLLVMRSRRKLLAVATVAALVAVGSTFVPKSFYERISSIAHYQQDASSMGRLNAWQASLHMANDYPVFGVGLDNFLFMFAYYAPDPEDVHVAHNTYLQVLAEAGYPGLALYLGLFGVAGWTLWRVRRRARRYRLDWAGNGARCLETSMLAFLVGGFFLNRAHFDLIYHVIVLGCCLDRIVSHEIQQLRRELEESGSQAVRAA